MEHLRFEMVHVKKDELLCGWEVNGKQQQKPFGVLNE